MLVRYYSVFDCVGDDFGPLFPAKNDNMAFRSFQLSFQEKKELNPDDYKLFMVCQVGNSVDDFKVLDDRYEVKGISSKDGE